MLPGLDGVAVKVGIPGRIGDHGGVDVPGGLAHDLHQGLLALVGVEVQQGGNALGHGLGGHDHHLFLAEGDALFGGHDYVLVVGEDEDGGGGGAVYLLEDVVGGGVHGLAAGDYAVGSQLPEQVLHALARADGDYAVFLFRLGHGAALFQLLFHLLQVVGALNVLAGQQVLVLGAHVLYLGQLQHAELLGLVQGVAGDVGVYMYLKGLVVLADDQAVAYAVEVFAQGLQVHVRLVLAHDEHGVEGEGDVLGAENVEGGLRGLGHLGGLGGGGHFPSQGGEHGPKDDEIALAAGVHNAGLFQHGVEVDGVLQGLFTGLDGADQAVFQAGPGGGCLGSGGGGQAGDGEYGALGRLHNGLVSGLHAVGHSAGELHGPCGLGAFQAPGDAPEQQGEDDAGVAPGAPEQGGGDTVGGGGNGLKILLAQLGGGLVHGQAHVGAGVSVGHGKDVQVVYHLGVGCKGRIGAENHLFERGGVYIISQVKSTSGGIPCQGIIR